MDPLNALGFVAAALTTLSFIPQLTKVWQTKSADDLSTGMFSAFSLGIALWLLYGVLRRDAPLILAYALTLALSVGILALKLRYRRAAVAGREPRAELR